MNATPTISVIIPAYNAEKYIEETIMSALNQTYKPLEIIVIDDCSTDATCAVVERLAEKHSTIRLIKNEKNLGVAMTRNRGIEEFKGDYVAFLDADDVWYGGKIEYQLNKIKATGVEMVYSSYDIVDTEGKLLRGYLVPRQIDYNFLLRENVIGCSTVLIKGSVAKKYRFKGEYHHEDYVMWLQMLKDGVSVLGCRSVLVKWRYFPDTRSFDKKNAAKWRWIIYRSHCELPFGKRIVLMASYALASLKKYGKHVVK